jgi:hypothetical protein
MYDRFLTAAGPDAVAYEIRREIRAISGRLVGEKTAEFTTSGVNGHSPDETAMRNLADYSEHFVGSFVLLRLDASCHDDRGCGETPCVCRPDRDPDVETELYAAENGLVRSLRPDVVYQAKISAMTDAEWDAYLKTPRPFESRFNRAAVDLAESARRSGEQS